jgi:hypothetical protein
MKKKKRRSKGGAGAARGEPGPPPSPGVADRGATLDPADLPDDSAAEEGTRGRRPWPAPGPGVPLSNEQYERLKENARSGGAPKSEHAQQDPAQKDEVS